MDGLKVGRESLVGQMKQRVVCDRDCGVWSDFVSVGSSRCFVFSLGQS